MKTVHLIYLLAFHSSHSADDLCDWHGSGLVSEELGAVLQVHLRCTEGSVEWKYPSQALRVVLEPNLSSSRHTTVCIKPLHSFLVASVYFERSGELHLLRTDDRRPEQVFCFQADGANRPAIYLQANQRGEINRCTVGFRYELLRRRRLHMESNTVQNLVQTACRPCNNTELLLAVCNSDFVIRGFIRNVSHNLQRQTSVVEVSEGKVYRQRSGVFEREVGLVGAPHRESSWHGHIYTLLQCRVKPGGGEFLFTGSELFGEAWLGCAPRLRDFLVLYWSARAANLTSCDFPLESRTSSTQWGAVRSP